MVCIYDCDWCSVASAVAESHVDCERVHALARTNAFLVACTVRGLFSRTLSSGFKCSAFLMRRAWGAWSVCAYGVKAYLRWIAPGGLHATNDGTLGHASRAQRFVRRCEPYGCACISTHSRSEQHRGSLRIRIFRGECVCHEVTSHKNSSGSYAYLSLRVGRTGCSQHNLGPRTMQRNRCVDYARAQVLTQTFLALLFLKIS
jgi:hypothetical protein